MNLNQLIADLKAISNNRQDLPVQVYDFTDIFQVIDITLQYDNSFPSKFVLNTKYYFARALGRELTVGELIDQVEKLLQSYKERLEKEPNVLWTGAQEQILGKIKSLEVEVLSPDKTQYTLANAEFDVRYQVCAITLGEIM